MKLLLAADLFCGAGGTSTGLARAAMRTGRKLRLLAVNHSATAIETHSRNHPDAEHLCESLDNVSPRQVVPGGRLNLLVASPECTHHSVARGGKPINDQSRASAWHILRWAEALYIDHILIENVREFESWGPIGANGRPLKSKRGETFHAFIRGLESLGYNVDWRVLNAAYYGDPTTRERLFIQARRGGRKVRWPEPTHGPLNHHQRELFGARQPWKTAREIIDWSLPGQSVFRRKRPLAPATLGRIAAGLKRFGGKYAEPFLVVLRNHMGAKSLDEPLPTLIAGGQNYGLCEPFVLSMQDGKFIVPTNHGIKDLRSYPLDKPMPTVTSVDAWGLVEPFLVSYYGTQNSSPVDMPAPTVTTKDRFGLVECDGLEFDIRFRMLSPRELARAQGFPDQYQFAGTREAIVKQIGNAVPVNLAEALCTSILEAA